MIKQMWINFKKRDKKLKTFSLVLRLWDWLGTLIASPQLQIYRIHPEKKKAETANDHVCPRFSSCSFSCRQTPVRLAAIRFPGRSLTGQAPPRPPLPPFAVRLTRTGSWQAAGRSWTQRWGCTALLTPRQPPPARTTPTIFPTAPTRLQSTPLWWAHFSLISCSHGGEVGKLSPWSITGVLFINLPHIANTSVSASRLIQSHLLLFKTTKIMSYRRTIFIIKSPPPILSCAKNI